MLLVSVFVDYDNWSRQGNRMFQYAFGYMFADIKNTKLFTPELPSFNIKSSLNATTPINGLYTKSYGNHYVDFEELKRTDRDIIVNSFVQKARYYIPYRDKLIDQFWFERKTINENSLVLHVRETDYRMINVFLGYEVYKSIIDKSGFTDVIIVTDNSECETVKRLVSEGCRLNSQGNITQFKTGLDERDMFDFLTLANSANIALSQSSFSWWAAFLGNHKKIIFPYVKNNGMWKVEPERDDIDLFFDFGYSIRMHV